MRYHKTEANIAAGYYIFHFSFETTVAIYRNKTNNNVIEKRLRAKNSQRLRRIISHSCSFNVGLNRTGVWNLLFGPRNYATLEGTYPLCTNDTRQ